MKKDKNKNLIPFKPGESGNPTGRPKGQKNYATLYREAIVKFAKVKQIDPDMLEVAIIEVGIERALKGDYKFYQDLQDRLHGKPIQKNELTGLDGAPLFMPTPEEQEKINKALDGMK